MLIPGETTRGIPEATTIEGREVRVSRENARMSCMVDEEEACGDEGSFCLNVFVYQDALWRVP